MIIKALHKQDKNKSTELENNEVNEMIDDQLRKSKERITRLKALAVKVKSDSIFFQGEVNEVIAGNVKPRGPKKLIN